ncbi:TPA: Lar family restriction alleviation protein [Burkholderia contaminans]|uniref:Lar family restriction alleviation protein n=1 Tax=Burkholderia contaminans TaxID=488447 RepID=UPI000CFED5A2|nr:Lar family restriction alleviation protein [Burkholderia contaminans]HDR9065529.1 Lar family restriction alleviation protein [Burkholderia vietnamiensis]MBM6427968.1 Lar family restriction alleviation protein [Burkholderia contaminans]MCA7876798.1 Lar family restriction alleviation protein [Burkholderia contaminans]MDN8024178.1 Lar family restriction alleviation protein [Burkholderia contaminans]PRG12181.1 hypothetical protein C6Q17_14075 [Burkholderia contaminans]
MTTTDKSRADAPMNLEPCPFCGNELHVKANRANPSARCVTDGCKGKQLPVLNLDQPEDIAAWNRRAPVETSRADALTDPQILSKAAHRAYSPKIADVTHYDFSESELIEFARDVLAASPVEQHEAALTGEQIERVINVWQQYPGAEFVDQLRAMRSPFEQHELPAAGEQAAVTIADAPMLHGIAGDRGISRAVAEAAFMCGAAAVEVYIGQRIVFSNMAAFEDWKARASSPNALVTSRSAAG